MSATISYTRVELCNYNQDINRSWFIYFDVTDITEENIRLKNELQIAKSKKVSPLKKTGTGE